MTLKEILHVLANGISLTAAELEKLHQGIDEHDQPAENPAPATDPAGA